jgi:hypothetical protein
MAKDDLQLLRLRLPRQVTRMTEDGRSATYDRLGLNRPARRFALMES